MKLLTWLDQEERYLCNKHENISKPKKKKKIECFSKYTISRILFSKHVHIIKQFLSMSTSSSTFMAIVPKKSPKF